MTDISSLTVSTPANSPKTTASASNNLTADDTALLKQLIAAATEKKSKELMPTTTEQTKQDLPLGSTAEIKMTAANALSSLTFQALLDNNSY